MLQNLMLQNLWHRLRSRLSHTYSLLGLRYWRKRSTDPFRMEAFGVSDGKVGEKWPLLWCHRKSSSCPSTNIKKAVMSYIRDFRGLEVHIPRYSITTQPFYNLLERNACWGWTPQHKDTLELLKVGLDGLLFPPSCLSWR